MKDDTIDQLRKLVAEHLDVNRTLDEIAPDAPLLGCGLGLDSLAIVELVTLTEECFAIEFGEGELNMDSFANLRALANVVTALRMRDTQSGEASTPMAAGLVPADVHSA
jgi:acyl carrier protein